MIVEAQESSDSSIEITFPLPGEAVQGLVQITGTVNVEELESYILEFAIQTSDNPAWFRVNVGETSITDGILGEWDTSSLPDQNYFLRLTINQKTSDSITLLIEGVRVRNYSPIETSTPPPTSILPTPSPTVESSTETSTPEITPSPTPLIPNPAAITVENIQKKLIQGAIAGTMIFFIFLIYRTSRNR